MIGYNKSPRVLARLEQRIADETLPPERRERARALRDHILQVWETRALMQDSPALCLKELERATARGSCRALELVYRYINRDFWNDPDFCREALRINSESQEWVKA
jgi:hypothetical protein